MYLMIERENQSFHLERAREIAWLQEHLDAFWELACEGFQESGRGVLVVDTRQVVEQEGTKSHPLMFVPQANLNDSPWTQEKEITRMVGEYEPSWELIAVLLKKDSGRVYRLGVYLEEDQRTERIAA